jgi:hypothetical protein
MWEIWRIFAAVSLPGTAPTAPLFTLVRKASQVPPPLLFHDGFDPIERVVRHRKKLTGAEPREVHAVTVVASGSRIQNRCSRNRSPDLF